MNLKTRTVLDFPVRSSSPLFPRTFIARFLFVSNPLESKRSKYGIMFVLLEYRTECGG